MDKLRKQVGNLIFEADLQTVEINGVTNYKVTNVEMGRYAKFSVSKSGEIMFNIYDQRFPYAEALNEIVAIENRTLCVNVPLGKKVFERIIESTKNYRKVPCSGVKLQIYYLYVDSPAKN